MPRQVWAFWNDSKSLETQSHYCNLLWCRQHCYCRHENCYPINVNSSSTELEQIVHTHRTSCRNGLPRGFGELNPSPHSWIFTCVSVGSSYLSATYLLPLRSIFLFTLHQSVAQNLSDMWRSTFEIGAAQKSRRNHSLHVWPEALPSMIIVPAQELLGLVKHSPGRPTFCRCSCWRVAWRIWVIIVWWAPWSRVWYALAFRWLQ